MTMIYVTKPVTVVTFMSLSLDQVQIEKKLKNKNKKR